MMRWKPWHTLLAGVGIILAANAVALLGVAYNRGGEPESRVSFSERELSLPYLWGMQRESSGIALSLRWRAVREKVEPYDYPHRPLPWLNKAKLRELGFAMRPSDDTPNDFSYYGRLQSRDILLVMELDGPAYQAALAQMREWAGQQQALAARNRGHADVQARAKRAGEQLRDEERTASRLFVVDAGLDAGALRARYPDRRRYVIMRGRVKPRLMSEGDHVRVEGVVEAVSNTEVHLPQPHSELFAPLTQQARRNADQGPRYTVTVAFGRRLEPWVVDVHVPGRAAVAH